MLHSAMAVLYRTDDYTARERREQGGGQAAGGVVKTAGMVFDALHVHAAAHLRVAHPLARKPDAGAAAAPRTGGPLTALGLRAH